MTLSKYKLTSEQWEVLPISDDFATLSPTDPTAIKSYAEYIISRKALFHTIMIQNIRIGMINAHLTPSFTSIVKETEKLLREKQATAIINKSKKQKSDLTILGMDMNDEQCKLLS